MRCTQTRALFSSYVDGAVSGVAMHEIAQHLESCSPCRSEYRQLESTRSLLAALGRKQAPPDLANKIRISVSSARSRGWREVLGARLVRLQNAFDAFMLPATAGTAAAIFTFAALIGFFVQAPIDVNADVPTIFYTPPRLESGAAYTDSDLDLDSSLLIETDVDASGHVQNYRIVSGRDDAQVREQLNRALLFTIFAPAQSFGRPVPGKAVISFSHIHVRG
jgi:Putative zinc-finger